MAVEHAASPLLPVVILLTAGVLAVPIFKRLGLGAVLGYFSAGILIGPHVSVFLMILNKFFTWQNWAS